MSTLFTRYDITLQPVDELEFEILPMPDFFRLSAVEARQPHIHSFYQIIYYRRAAGVHYVDFHRYPVADRTLFFLSPGQIHRFDERDDAEGVIIHFNERFLADEETGEQIFLKYDLFNAFNATPCFTVVPPDALRLDTLIGEMQAELDRPDAFAHRDCLLSLLRLFLIYMQRNGRRTTDAPLSVRNSSHRLFVRFRRLVERHYHELHTVSAYADRLNVSVRTLTNSVSESAHATPLGLINDRIALEAARQLRHSDLKVKEIAYRLGFDDPSYFAKFFKRRMGCLPAEFRSRAEAQTTYSLEQ